MKYEFKNRVFVMNVGETDDFGLPQKRRIFVGSSFQGHMVLRPGEMSVEESKKKAAEGTKEKDRTYEIIMNDKPRHRFHLRYVDYTMGILLGCRALYGRNDTFRGWCDAILQSYRQGTIIGDFKGFIYNAYLAAAELLRQWTDRLATTKFLKNE